MMMNDDEWWMNVESMMDERWMGGWVANQVWMNDGSRMDEC
jgi:hypothetical protein